MHLKVHNTCHIEFTNYFDDFVDKKVSKILIITSSFIIEHVRNFLN